MTRDEFIDGYLKRSGMEKHRTKDGYAISKYRRVALECACGHEGCEGWAMVTDDPESRKDHATLYAPMTSAEQPRGTPSAKRHPRS